MEKLTKTECWMVDTYLRRAAQKVGVKREEHLEGPLRPHGLCTLRQQARAVHQPQPLCQLRELIHHCRQAH